MIITLTTTTGLLKVASLCSDSGDLVKAADIFEKVNNNNNNNNNNSNNNNNNNKIAVENMQSNLGKFSAKGFLFQSLLCILATGDWLLLLLLLSLLCILATGDWLLLLLLLLSLLFILATGDWLLLL